MRKMKKVLAMLLTLAMVLGMSMTTMAAGSATITIDGADGTVYKYMQLVVEDRDATLGWQFASTSIASAFVDAFDVEDADKAIAALIDLGVIEAQTEENHYVELGDINPSAALGEALQTLKASATGEISGSTVNFEEFGLYMITASHDDYAYIPMAVYVNTAYDDVDVVAKGAKKEITKDIDEPNDKSVSEGDVVEYTAKTVYPYYSADAQNPKFEVTDKLTNATYNRNSVNVYLDVNADGEITEADRLLVNTTDYTVEFKAPVEGETFTEKMEIKFVYNAAYASENVVIKYDVTVGAGAAAVGNAITSTFDTTEDYVELDKVEVKVVKVNEENKVLSGATFKIYEAVDAATNGYTAYENATVYGVEGKTTLYLKDVTANSLPEGVTEAITDANGNLTFVGLDAQKTYYVQETNAPEGYRLNDNFYKLDNGAETGDTEDKTYEFTNFGNETVVNTKLSALPSTGGIGTTIFTIAGCGIMIAAAYLFFANRRKDA